MNNKYEEAFKRLCKHTEQLQVFQLIDNDPAFPFNKIAYEEDKKTIKELVEKATPKKPIYKKVGNNERPYCCDCGLRLKKSWVVCPRCEKKIDWSEENMMELERRVADLRSGKSTLKEHELIEVE